MLQYTAAKLSANISRLASRLRAYVNILFRDFMILPFF